MTVFYCCSHEGNECEKKDTCRRYLTQETSATLFKMACTPDNNRVLYLENHDTEITPTNSNEN